MRFLPRLCASLASIFLLVFFAYPLLSIIGRSFTLETLLEVINNPYYATRLWFSVWQALLSTLLTVMVALPTAVLFANYTFYGKKFLRSVFMIPFVMPTVVAAIGFLALLGPRGLLGLNLQGSLVIILLAHVFYNYGLVVRIVSAYLEGLAPRLYEAGRVLGLGSFGVFWRLSLPLATPAIIAAAILVFIFTFTSFGIILILAPDPQFATLEVEIYRLSSRFFGLEQAGILVFVQLLVIMSFTWVYTLVQAKRSVRIKPSLKALPRPKGAARYWLGANIVLVCLLVLSPLFALIIQAFWPAGQTYPSLAYFQALLSAKPTIGFAGLGQAVRNSLGFAALSTVLSLVTGFVFAYAVVRAKASWLDNLSLLPLATSAVTLGFGYLIAFPALRSSIWGLGLAHSLIAFPFVTRSLLPALRSLPPNLLHAAYTLGASPREVLSKVELPLLIPSFITAASLAFAVSMGEFGASLTLQPLNYATVPLAIFDRLGRPGLANYGSAMALAFILMLITAGVILVLERFGESEF